MRKAALFVLALLLALVGGRPAAAASFEWGGFVEGRAGYGTNPYLNTGSNAGSGLVGFTVAPTLRWREAAATTELSGSYNRDQYFTRYGHADDYNVDLRRTQQLSARLTAHADVGYFSSVSGLLSPYYNSIVIQPGAVDQLAVGTRQQRVYGSAGVDWQPTARDTLGLTGVAERDDFSHYGGDYSYVGATAQYRHTIDARTRVGFDLTVGKTFSNDFPDSSNVQPSLEVQRTLNAHWTFNGGIGAIIEHQRANGASRTSVSPGFNASLCGTYPRLSVCVTGSRSAAVSGIGGLRRQTQFGVDATYRLSEHSRVLAVATAGVSAADQRVVIDNIAYGNQRFVLARVDYQRDLNRRLTAGVSGSYQRRTGAGLPEVHALAITFNLTARFGHLT